MNPSGRTLGDRPPAILGALLDLTAKVLAVLPNVTADRLPRMADFARVLAALAEVTGWSSLGVYEAMGGRLAEEVIEARSLRTNLYRAAVGPPLAGEGQLICNP